MHLLKKIIKAQIEQVNIVLFKLKYTKLKQDTCMQKTISTNPNCDISVSLNIS